MRSAAFTSLDYQVVSSLIINPQRAEVRFRITLVSAAIGDIIRENRMDLTRLAGEPWRIAWTDAVILPELEGGNGLSLAPVTPTRANIYDRNNRAFAAEATADQPNAAALWIVPNQVGDEEERHSREEPDPVDPGRERTVGRHHEDEQDRLGRARVALDHCPKAREDQALADGLQDVVEPHHDEGVEEEQEYRAAFAGGYVAEEGEELLEGVLLPWARGRRA